jgi:hypothetical protein
LAADEIRALEITLIQTDEAIVPAAAKICGVYRGNSIVNASIPVDVGDVNVIDNVNVIAAAVIPAAIPGVVRFKGGKRNPSEVSKAETNIDSRSASAEADKGDKSGAPVVAAVNRPRPPAPAARPLIPTTVVIGSPAPGIIAHPAPTVIIDPGPASVAIRRPIDGNPGSPHISIRSVVHPFPVIIEIFGARDGRADVAIRGRTLQVPVAAFVPLVPIIAWDGSGDLKFRIVRCPAHEHRAASSKPLGTTRRKDIHFAGSHSDFGSVVREDSHAV